MSAERSPSTLHQTTSLARCVDRFIDRLMPPAFDADPAARRRVRLFMLSHLGGPVLGLLIPSILMVLDPHPFPHVQILATSILAFWAFPFLLRRWPQHYMLLASLSLLNLNFSVLWGAYHYGGASSPI